jgi:hypothetical protein
MAMRITPLLMAATIFALPRGATIAEAGRTTTESPIVPAGLWRSLPAPDPAMRAWLVLRVPELEPGSIRVLTTGAIDGMLTGAIARGLSPLDFFTDSGFRRHEVYFLPRPLLVSIFTRYKIAVLTAVSGTDTKGRPFEMQGLVLGGGHVDALYDRDGITFANPEFDNGRFTLSARVSQGILGPGDLSVTGITAHVALFNPSIQRITKISPAVTRVKTSLGSRNKPTTLIGRR